MTKSDIVKTAFLAWEPDMYKSKSLSVLASYLGVSKTALYRHFKNKDAIVDAMFASYFNDYFVHIKPKFEEALNEKDEIKGFFILMRGITQFYAQNKQSFTFSLCELHDYRNDSSKKVRTQMENWGIELKKLPYFLSREHYFMIAQLSATVAVFMTATLFYHSGIETLNEKEMQHLLDRTEHQISYGLGFSKEELDAVNYDELDEMISHLLPSDAAVEDNLLKAVANAIAQAGSKDASMGMVAKYAGLSKSGLYSHFKSKEDMLRQFFTTEFEKILGDLEASPETVFPKAEKPAEQLYLLSASTIRYLQAKPEIMIALDWIRTQRIDLGLSMPEVILSRFSDPHFIKDIPEAGGRQMSVKELPHFIIFCIMGFLKSHYCMGKEMQISKENIRFLYTFLISGVKGGKI